MMGFKGSAVPGGKVGRVKILLPGFGNFVKIPETNNFSNRKTLHCLGFVFFFFFTLCGNLSPVPCALPPFGS